MEKVNPNKDSWKKKLPIALFYQKKMLEQSERNQSHNLREILILDQNHKILLDSHRTTNVMLNLCVLCEKRLCFLC